MISFFDFRSSIRVQKKIDDNLYVLCIEIDFHENNSLDFAHQLFFHSNLSHLHLIISDSLITHHCNCIHSEREMHSISKSILLCITLVLNFINFKVFKRYFLIAFSMHKQTKMIIDVSKKSNMSRMQSLLINFMLKKFQKISIRNNEIISIVKRFSKEFNSSYEMIIKTTLIKIIFNSYLGWP